jgi:hypothetical protein
MLRLVLLGSRLIDVQRVDRILVKIDILRERRQNFRVDYFRRGL